MRGALLYSLGALISCAVADDAYLFTVDHGTTRYATTQASSISSETASSIIARRRGLLKDHHLAGIDETLLREVKQYGGYQVPMYGTTSDPAPAKVLIRISGYTGTVSHFPSLPDLWIEDATEDLADDFEARKDVEGVCEYNLSNPTKNGVDLVYSYDAQGSPCMTMQELKIRPTVLALLSAVPIAEDFAKNMNTFMRTLSHLAVTEDLESTILILPPLTKLGKPKSVPRADPSEKLLEFDVTSAESSSSTFSATATATASARPTHPLPSIVPQCFSSKNSCESTTNTCSGHGSCYRAHNGCYKCRCGSTVVRVNKDGSQKTVQWGGNACQKKDISIEFVLLASFGVVMTALVAGAIGALYTMGSQELPSVIAAGVSGPKQK